MTKLEVIKAFLQGISAKNATRSISTDGEHLFSYNAQIAFKTADGSISISNKKWSQTTSCHQGLCRRVSQQLGYTVTSHG